MGVNCKIKLPLSTSSYRIFTLAQKLVGAEYKLAGDNKKEIDETIEPSEDNYWYPRYPNKLEPTRISGYSLFTLNTITKQEHQWHFFFEEEEENWKILHLPCDAFSQAIAKRIVDFFGGIVLYADYHDWDDKEHTYENNNPTFPKKETTQTSDDRFLQFYQVLFHEKELNYTDFEAIKQKENMTDEDIKLVETLKTQKLYRSLNNNVDKKNTTISPHVKRMKV
jgi:hypothetical protein